MNKNLKTLSCMVCLTLICTLLFAGIVLGATYDARATTHALNVGGGTLTVTSPALAYDNSNVTRALTAYARGQGYNGPGNIEFKLFDGGSPRGSAISQVNLTIGYKTTLPTANAQYKISFFADPSATETTLKGPTADAVTVNQTWTLTDPNNGVWDWPDVDKLRVRFTTYDSSGADTGGLLYIYEVWLKITYTPVKVFVNPQAKCFQSETAPFTVDVNITSVIAFYGWEFKLYYDTTLLTATSVTQGSFLQTGGKSTYYSTISINDVQGYVWATCTITGDTAGQTGSGTLATINFSFDGPHGRSTLDLRDVKLVGYDTVAKAIYSESNAVSYDGLVTRLLGDISRDGWVSSPDLTLQSQSYGGYSIPNADLDTNGLVEVNDLYLLSKDWQPAP